MLRVEKNIVKSAFNVHTYSLTYNLPHTVHIRKNSGGIGGAKNKESPINTNTFLYVFHIFTKKKGEKTHCVFTYATYQKTQLPKINAISVYAISQFLL